MCVKQQPRAGTLEDRFLATEAGNGDVTRLIRKELELVRDIERYFNSSLVYFNAQLRLWNQSPEAGLNSAPAWTCPW